MANWFKIITSGSNAELNTLNLTNALGVQYGGTGLTATSASGVLIGSNTTTFSVVGTNGSGRVLRENGAIGVIMSGSFSGSFIGNGAGLTGILADSSIPISGSFGGMTFQTATDTLQFTTASVHGFDLSSSFASTRKLITLVTPQDLRTTASPQFTGLTVGSSTFGTNTTIAGDLTVLGTTVQLQITNLNIEDKFILLNSGSATGDSGFIFSSGSGGNGVAFGWDESAARWGIQQNTLLAPTATTLAPEAYLAAVVDVDGGQSDNTVFQRNGNMKIQGGEIYIYA